tara:strand:- start:1055 stop:1648 length:594 start_codon:yes stop_codon:yes gene_type:complete
MKISSLKFTFTSMYDYVIKLANKKNVLKYLYGLSFIEAFIFPVPPDALLAPIALTKKYSWFKLALNTTLFSVCGGLVGYFIGFYLNEISFLNSIVNEDKLLSVKNIFLEHGVWVIIIAGFTPLPFKVATLTAGYMSLALIPFIIASIIGRGLRFFLVASIFHYFGIELANRMRKYFEYIGLLVTIFLLFFIYNKYFS